MRGAVFALVAGLAVGKREVFLPEKWIEQGFTHRLTEEQQREVAAELHDERQRRLEELRDSLRQFAATNDGAYPQSLDDARIPEGVRQPPHSGGLQYVFMPKLTLHDGVTVLAYEPEIFGRERLVLLADGQIVSMGQEHLRSDIGEQAKP
jgi:hypothetical protein